MKTLTRIMIGLTSSLLAAAGLFRVAEKLDPLSHALRNVTVMSTTADRPSEDCTCPSAYLPPDARATAGQA
jgi:hypothetical protein